MLNMVRGCHIPFTSNPPKSFMTFQPRFDQAERALITAEVSKLLEKGAIVQALPDPKQVISHLFLRPKKDGTNRPIFNLKRLNEFYDSWIAQYETGKLLVIDCDQLNFVENEEDLAGIYNKVQAELHGLF